MAVSSTPLSAGLEARGTDSFFRMFSDKLLSPVSKQSAGFATVFRFKQEYAEALLQKHLLCPAKLECLACVSLVFFFFTCSVLIPNFHSKNTAQRHGKWHRAL